MKMNFVVFVLFVLTLFYCVISNVSPKETTSSNQELSKDLQCRVCNEMFNYDFDFERFLHEKSLIEVICQNGKYDVPSIEIASKEISMQFFFKGGDSQYESYDNIVNCKKLKVKEEKCEKSKAKLCESILSLEENICHSSSGNQVYEFPKYKHESSSQDAEKFNKMSLLELNPEYVVNNFDSIPKTHWKPPKPVLLQNFENNIGDQLKEISILTA